MQTITRAKLTEFIEAGIALQNHASTNRALTPREVGKLRKVAKKTKLVAWGGSNIYYDGGKLCGCPLTQAGLDTGFSYFWIAFDDAMSNELGDAWPPERRGTVAEVVG